MLSFFIRQRVIALKTFALFLSAIFVSLGSEHLDIADNTPAPFLPGIFLALGSGGGRRDDPTKGASSLSVFVGPGGDIGTQYCLPGVFFPPSGVAIDSVGNIYVTDQRNNIIRKINPAGVVSIFAGTPGVSGSADGAGAAARFNAPQGIATDSVGNVYVADTHSNTIRKITPAGVVSTFAGTAGKEGSANGTGAKARFRHPGGVATDHAGNVYVADSGNETIRKITPAGVVSTFAGTAGDAGAADGTGATAHFYHPRSVATDSAGNVYVADTLNYIIRKITPDGVVSTLAGKTDVSGAVDGIGAAASFSNPVGIVSDGAGNVYVSDIYHNNIRKITPTGVVSTFAGTTGNSGSTDGTGTATRFFYPTALAIDSAGNLYVADYGNYVIRKITPAGVVSTHCHFLTEPWGSDDGTGSAARFGRLGDISTDSAGNVYVADTRNHTIRKITPAGVVTTLAGTAGSQGSTNGTGMAASFCEPYGVAVDDAGNVYVADTFNHAIRKITPAGVVSTFAGRARISGAGNGTRADMISFKTPFGIAIDSAGNIYVADCGNHIIRKITPAGVVTTLAGTAGSPGSTDGKGARARFFNPHSLAVDSTGNVYVADTFNHTIRKITPLGVVATLAGTAGDSGSSDGTGAAALFSLPLGITVDSTGNLYVADSVNNTIRKITAAGVVTTVVGTVGSVGVVPGSLPGSIRAPYGVTRFGNDLYISIDNGVLKVSNVP